MPKEVRWHKMVKEGLEEIGENKGYDVSESEKEIVLASRFKMYVGERRKIYTLAYKPDVVWKKGRRYKAIFEIEYLNPQRTSQIMDKRKYSIGSLMLAYLAMIKKSVRRLIFITNNRNLCSEIASFIQLTPIKFFEENIIYLHASSTSRSDLLKDLERASNELKL